MSRTKHRVLLIGSGGREHALAWKIAQSPHLDKLYIAPGNAGSALHGENLPISENDFMKLAEQIREKQVNMIVVGPEAPLVAGIRDFFQQQPGMAGIPVIGPSKQAAMLEGSKDFAKAFMLRHHIPTAAYRSFQAGETEQAVDFLDKMSPPYVLKADGLAAGKGVIICPDKTQAVSELREMLDHARFGEASRKVVIEEFLDGIELSVFILTDGLSYALLPSAKDYKRIGEGDKGPNTGGMGAVSPVPFADETFMKKVEQQIIRPTLQGLNSEGIDYVGFIFFGLIKVGDQPYVIEYNARLGDPETEAILPRIDNDLLDLFEAVASKSLSRIPVRLNPRYSACVMAVAPGYPGSYPKGMVITGTEKTSGSLIFHSGTRIHEASGEVVTNGGRVLAVTSLDEQLAPALQKCYSTMKEINFEGLSYRKDIGQDLMKYI